MKKIKLSNGFECEINEHVIHDIRFVRLVKRLQTDTTVIDDLVEFIFGKEQAEKFYESITMEDGTIPTDRFEGCDFSVSDALTEITDAFGAEGKN